MLFALPAAAAYDLKGIALGAQEKDLRRALPSARCKALEWQSRAADRRCDDSRVAFGGIEVKVTFYLKKGVVEAFDLRFDTKELDRFVGFLKSHFGPPQSESRDSFPKGKSKSSRDVHRVLWERAGERAVLTAQLEKSRAALLVYRGEFEEEIYRVR
ncbi:MAG: hypothetical protein ACREUS_09385 [Burkholderiales bacterium]